MSEIVVVIEQIFLLLIVGLIGYLAGRFNYLPANSDKAVAALVVKITAPLMILTKMYNMEFNAEDYINGVKLYFFAIFFILLAYGISLAAAKLFKVRGCTAKIFSMQMMFGNVIYFALPLIAVLSSELPEVWSKGTAYAMFYVLGNDTIMWTLGISLVSNKEGDSFKTRAKHLINGNTIAFLIGIIILLTGARQFISSVHILDVFMDKLSDVGGMTAHLSMLFIGLMMSKLSIVSVIKNFKEKYIIFISSFVKLILLPVLAIVILKALNGFLPLEPAKALILQLAMPGATIVAALAGEYDSDAEFAAEGIFVSTLLLTVTLPFVLWLTDIIL